MPIQAPAGRTRGDLCPGVSRPWPAADGGLVRLRLVGGRVTSVSLAALLTVSRRYGDGDVHLTTRANLQVRGLPLDGEALPPEVDAALVATGLVPSRTHELVRNVVVSPQTGTLGGLADLRGLAARLDTALCAAPALAGLPGRFLLVLDDGRGDVIDRPSDLAVMALDERVGQLRVGRHWGPVVPLATAETHLVALAGAFLDARGEGPTAAWHVDELPTPLTVPREADPRTGRRTPPPDFDDHHVPVADGRLTPALAADLLADADGRDLVVTPWHSVWTAP